MDLKLNMKLELTPELKHLVARYALGALLLAAVVVLAVVMPVLEGRKLTREAEETRERTKRQMALLPTWASLSQFSSNSTVGALLPPAKKPVERARAYAVPDDISQMARALGVDPVDVTLNPTSLTKTPNAIEVNGVFAGSFEGLHGLLAGLSAMPSLEAMDKMELRSVDGHLELFIQMRVALGS